jgi:hypothetical protein
MEHGLRSRGIHLENHAAVAVQIAAIGGGAKQVPGCVLNYARDGFIAAPPVKL